MDHTPNSLKSVPRSVVVGAVVGWVLIALKCSVLPLAFEHWQVPVHPGWVVIPTLVFGGLVTFLIATHDWQRE